MHCSDLVELGALLAIQGHEFAQSPESFPAGSLTSYWAASRCRFDRWGRFLKDASSALETQRHTKFLWQAIRPGLEEILASDLLTRILAAAGTAHDVYFARQEAAPVMASVVAGHQEARQRALALLAKEENGVTVRLRRLRRQGERWTDLFLAHLAPLVRIERWAFQEERVQEFARDLAEERPQPTGDAAAGVLLAALRGGFLQELHPEAANPDLNEPLTVAVLHCLPGSLLDQQSGAADRLRAFEAATKATEDLLEQLVTLQDEDPLPPAATSRHLPSDWFGWN